MITLINDIDEIDDNRARTRNLNHQSKRCNGSASAWLLCIKVIAIVVIDLKFVGKQDYI